MFDPEEQQALAIGLASQKNGRMPADGYLEDGKRAARQERTSALDTSEFQALHRNLLGHYTHELDVQAENREEMALDEDFYDGIQWSMQEQAELQRRGQFPISYNVINTTVDWVLGTQRRAAADYKILPRRKDGLKAAERKTDLIKHVMDTNRSTFEVSKAFAESVKAGVGWMEHGQGDEFEDAKVFDRQETWRAMLWDSTATRNDLHDARYISRTKFLDLDMVQSLWPDRAAMAAASADLSSNLLTSVDYLGDIAMDARELAHFDHPIFGRAPTSEFSSARYRSRIIEIWFKKPVNNATLMKGGQFHGELFDPWSPGHHHEVVNGRATIVQRPREVIFCAIMTDNGFLDLKRAPYRHNRYPFTPIWGKRRASDLQPYGIIRNLRDIQRDTNKRASKSLFILSTARVYVQKGAVDDVDELREEAARPDSMIEYNPGFQKPEIVTDHQLANSHMEMMSRNISMMQQVGGVTDENLGRRTNATSGIAIERRQDQGGLATSGYFENLREAFVIRGEKLLVLIEQFYTEQEQFRITDARGNPQFVDINDGQPDNAIADHKADFVITDDDWRASARQAQAAQLIDLASQLAPTAPELVVGMLDLIVEALDVSKRDELVKRIRQITKQPDPDADPNNPDQATLDAMAKEAEESAFAKRAATAEVESKEAQTAKLRAETAKLTAGTPALAIANVQAAMQAAIEIAGAPQVAQAADQILLGAMEAIQTSGPIPQPQMPMPPQGMADPATMQTPLPQGV